MNSTELKEKRQNLKDEIKAMEALREEEKREFTAEETKSVDFKFSEIDKLGGEIRIADKIESLKAEKAAAGAETQKKSKDEEKIARKFNIGNVIRALNPQDDYTLEGVEKEVGQEGENEMREMGKDQIGFSVPASMLEERTDIDQSTSAIQSTTLNAYVDAIRAYSVHDKVGIRPVQLTGDHKVPIITKQSTAWAATENAAAADGGQNAATDTLTPFRATGYVDISNEILSQNGIGFQTKIMEDLGRSAGNLIDTALFSTASVSNAPPSIPAKSGVQTFTESTYTANTSIYSDFVKGITTLAENDAMSGPISYVAAPILMTDLMKSAQVASVVEGMMGTPSSGFHILGFPVYFSTAATNATTSGDVICGDFTRVILGQWGGFSLTVDPYTVLLNNQIRLVIHQLIDWSIPQGAAFVKWTSPTE